MFTLPHTRQSFALIILMSLLCFFGAATATVYGATAQYQPLVGIPGLATAQGTGLASYLNRLYVITIGIGAIIAFVKIAMAGVKWSMSDVVTDKGAAKEDIKGALLGLAILLIPFIVLNTIYPGLTSLNILQNAGSSKLDLNQSSTPTTAPVPAGTGPVLNADGSQSGNVTKSACDKRAADVGGTAIWTYAYTSPGGTQYGTCTITPAPQTGGSVASLSLLGTTNPGATVASCTLFATSLRVPPITYTEIRMQSNTTCQVWGRP